MRWVINRRTPVPDSPMFDNRWRQQVVSRGTSNLSVSTPLGRLLTTTDAKPVEYFTHCQLVKALAHSVELGISGTRKVRTVWGHRKCKWRQNSKFIWEVFLCLRNQDDIHNFHKYFYWKLFPVSCFNVDIETVSIKSRRLPYWASVVTLSYIM